MSRRTRAAEVPGQCRACGGPCRTHKGSVHRWTCQGCLDRHLAEEAARADARAAADMERRVRKAARVWAQVRPLEKRRSLGSR